MDPRKGIAFRILGNLGVWVAVFIGSAVGCGKKPDGGDVKVEGAGKKPPLALQQKDGNAPPVPSGVVTFEKAVELKSVFLEPPDDVGRPPDRTLAGKNVAQLFEKIAGKDGKGGLWDHIAFSTPEGKRLRYSAQVKTDLGQIEIELYPDAAPNHVRSFVALARAGYYDGLRFDRSSRVQVGGDTLALLYGGCPLGTWDLGQGSIGYWLKPEWSSTLTHEEGMIGAWRHPENPETAACRFYIALSKTSGMDGAYTLFGKITRGLDVAHTISKRPNTIFKGPDGGDELTDEPRQPVVIRSVTIHTTEETMIAIR